MKSTGWFVYLPLTWLRAVFVFPIQSIQRIDAMQPDDFDHP